ncbi:MAG: apolipoprotein N-acyltransferase [Acidimicrobiales bacterium]
MRRRAGWVVNALAAGGAIALAMPPWGWWPLAFIGFALFGSLLGAPRRRSRFVRGWLVGAAWLVPSTFWMVDFSLPGYVFAGVFLSAYVGVAAAAVPPLAPRNPGAEVGTGRDTGWRTYLALPAAIAAAEFARTTVPFGGVPLSTVAMTQAASPLGPVARIGGGVALTLVTVAVGAALLALWRGRWVVSGALVAAVLALVGVAAMAPAGTDLGPLEVAVVQGGGPQRTRALSSDARAVFDRHLAASSQVTPGVDLVIWPENVLDVRGALDVSHERDELVALAQQLQAPVVAGIVESFPGAFYNASVVITPDGDALGRYDKVRRVPFGEYVPFRGVIDGLSGGAVSRYVPNDAVAGTGPATIETPDGRAGIVISWEVFFERRARDAIGNGGQVLLNPTNGSSYWLTIVQSQQVASSRLRALETGRWVLQAAPTGFSAVIDPDGNVHQRTGISERAVLEQTVQRRDGLTWSVRFGPWPWLSVAMLVLIGANVAATRAARSRIKTVATRTEPSLDPTEVDPADQGTFTTPAAPSPGPG